MRRIYFAIFAALFAAAMVGKAIEAKSEESTAYEFGRAIGSVFSGAWSGAKDVGAGIVGSETGCEQHYTEMSDVCLEEWRDVLARSAVAVEREINRRRSGNRG